MDTNAYRTVMAGALCEGLIIQWIGLYMIATRTFFLRISDSWAFWDHKGDRDIYYMDSNAWEGGKKTLAGLLLMTIHHGDFTGPQKDGVGVCAIAHGI